MSFLRHGQIYQSDGLFVSALRRSRFGLRLRSHRFDEFAASYSLAGWSPPGPTSALPAGSTFKQPAETFNHLLRRVATFSTGRMGNFQPVLTVGVLPAFLLLYLRPGVHEPCLWVTADAQRREAPRRQVGRLAASLIPACLRSFLVATCLINVPRNSTAAQPAIPA
jgi:hypothetical protein